MTSNDSSPPVIKVLQINLNHSWTAQQLLTQTMVERKTDVALISDYNHPITDEQHWVSSSDRKCAVFFHRNSRVTLAEHGSGIGFAWARTRRAVFYSCYCTPNCTIEAFDSFLSGLELSIRNQNGREIDLIVAGDFNSHSAEWGSATEDARGSMLSGFAAALDLQICNIGMTPTYRRVNASSVIDVTFSRSAQNNRMMVDRWAVLSELNSASDHEYVEFMVRQYKSRSTPTTTRCEEQVGWSVKKLSADSLSNHWESEGPPPAQPPYATAEEHTAHLQEFLKRACDAAMPRRTTFQRRRPVPWWSDEIAELRKANISARRRYQRAGRRSTQEGRVEAFAEYNRLRKELRLAIRKAQEASWRTLCQNVEHDPWGVPFKLVMKKLGRRNPVMEEQSALAIARGLFPALPSIVWTEVPVVVQPSSELETTWEDCSELLTKDDLITAANRLPNGKAPGPDNIPNEVIKLATHRYPEIFLDAFNACIETGHFPARWKVAKLVLLYKGQGKHRDTPSSYRPISLLDGVGKLLESLLLRRLEKYVEKYLSNRQFGFRRGRSTMDAIAEVIQTARKANRGAVQNRDLCAVVTLDVKNAFNSAPWRLIDDALQGSGVPAYLVNILRSYMTNRSIIIGTDTASPEIPVTCGVPQGSVLGPTLWNLFYDGILRLPVPDGVKLVAFADDVAVVAVQHNADLIEDLVNPVLEDITRWMTDNGLELAPEKSECVILTGKYGFRNPLLYVDGHQIAVKRSIRYLGVQLDTRLSFSEHASTAAAGAKKAATALGRLMPNVGGPSQSKRYLLMTVVHSRLLYGAQVWADSISGTRKSETLLTQSQRCAALRVTRCFRTVSDMAALVLARMPPAYLLANERMLIANFKKSKTAFIKSELRRETIRQWQTVWDTTTKGRWTYKLIPDICRWWYQGPISVSFNMAQVLTGHGCFQKYLWSKKRTPNPSCAHCPAAEDTAEHTIFTCPFWINERADLVLALRRQPLPGDVQDMLCGPSPEDLPTNAVQRAKILEMASRMRKRFTDMVDNIMKEKQRLERERQSLEAA